VRLNWSRIVRRLLPTLAVIVVAAVLVVGFIGHGGSDSTASTVLTPSITATTAQSPSGVPSVTVGSAVRVHPVSPGFLGFSFEYYVIGEYAGTSDTANPLFTQLVRNLSPGQRPVIRIGGDSTDWAYLPTAGVTKVKGLKVSVTPAVIKAIAATAKALNAKLVLGINLEADSTALAKHMADALAAAVPRSDIAAWEIGNEPELYDALGWYANRDHQPVYGRAKGWSLADYTQQFNQWGKVLPSGIGLAGAASGSAKWDAGVTTFAHDADNLTMVTVHGYPLQACGAHPGAPGFPSISRLLSAASTTGLVQSLLPARAAAAQAGIPIRVDETQSVSCFGEKGTSNTMAAALWSLETAFEFARAGFDGLNYTTLPSAQYRMWAFSDGSATVTPQYYGVLDFADAVPAGSKVLSTPTTSSGPQTFAVKTPSGQIHVVIVNSGSASRLAVRVRGGGGGTATATYLRGASLRATSGVTLAGESFGPATGDGDRTSTGTLTGTASGTEVEPVDGAYVVDLPADSATTLSVG
jgi:hypothetical protein